MAEKIDAYELKELEETFNKNAWELFEYIRSESKHEHSLFTGRVTWYITCQSFLLLPSRYKIIELSYKCD
jgi:hypothetical protein